MPKRKSSKGGRPTKYNKKLAEEICDRMSNGQSLLEITKDKKMPARASVYKWLGENEWFSDKYAAARDLRGDHMFDEIERWAKDETIDVQRAKLMVDTRKWYLSKMKPKNYGDKVDITSGGEKIESPIALVSFVGEEKDEQAD